MRSSLLWVIAVAAAIGLRAIAVYLPILQETGNLSVRRQWHVLNWPTVGLLAAGELLLGVAFSRLPFVWGLQPLLLCVGAIVPALVVHGVVVVADVGADPTSHNLWPFEFVILGGICLVAAAAGAYAGRALALAMVWKSRDNAGA